MFWKFIFTIPSGNERQWKDEDTAEEVNNTQMFCENITINFVLDTALADVDDDADVQDNCEDDDDDDWGTLQYLRH